MHTLGEVRGDRPMRLICQSVRNAFPNVEPWGSPQRYEDCVATYAILTESKLSNAKLAEVQIFVNGMIAGLSASGLI